MTEKPKPKHIIRTRAPQYFFGSGKAAEAQMKRRGTTRQTSKLPTSLDEMKRLEKAAGK